MDKMGKKNGFIRDMIFMFIKWYFCEAKLQQNIVKAAL